MTIAVLTYSSRSGSTFLARLLADQYDVCVVPEFQCGYGLLALPVGTVLSLSDIRRFLEADRQITWIGDSDLDALDGDKWTSAAVIEWIAQRYREQTGNESRDYLLKLGGLCHMWPRVAEHIPDVRGLNVIRDGRAVTNSLLASASPYLSENIDMGYGDPIWCARTWSRDVTAQQRCEASYASSYRTVRYEDIILDPDRLTREIGDIYGWQASPSSTMGFAVAAPEQTLHQHINEPALMTRISGWKDELSRSQRIVVESFAKKELAALGYTDFLEVGRVNRAETLVLAEANHVCQQARGWAYRIQRLRSASDVGEKIRRRVVSRTAWRD